MILSPVLIIAQFFYFLAVIYVAFFIPGYLTLYRTNLTQGQKVGLSFIIGMVLWGFQAILVGYSGYRWISYLYLLLCILLYAKFFLSHIRIFKSIPVFLQKQDKLILTIIFLGIFFQLLSIVLLGIYYQNNIYFCCATPDSLFHISLTNSAVKTFPPQEPAMVGVVVQNYHYFTNMIVADLVRLFHLPLIYSLFQYSVILLSLLWASSLIIFADINELPTAFKRWCLFFIFFSGDLVYLFLFILGKGLNFQIDYLHNPMQLWNSPSRVFAIVVFTAGLVLFSYWVKRKNFYIAFLISILFGSLISFKVYVGIFALFGLGIVILYYLLQKKDTNNIAF